MRCNWSLIFASILAGATWAAQAQSQEGQQAELKQPQVKLANVPPGLPPLASEYTGRWKEEVGGRSFSGTNKLKVLQENPLDEKGTWSADVVFNSYGGQPPCGNWTDAKGQLRWRQSEVIFFVIRHPIEMCNTSWTMKFTRQPSGKLTWTQSDGRAEIVFDPN